MSSGERHIGAAKGKQSETEALCSKAGAGGWGGCKCMFFAHFVWLLSCLQFPCIVAIHGQGCVTCTILTRGADKIQMRSFAFFSPSHLSPSQLASPPPPPRGRGHQNRLHRAPVSPAASHVSEGKSPPSSPSDAPASQAPVLIFNPICVRAVGGGAQTHLQWVQALGAVDRKLRHAAKAHNVPILRCDQPLDALCSGTSQAICPDHTTYAPAPRTAVFCATVDVYEAVGPRPPGAGAPSNGPPQATDPQGPSQPQAAAHSLELNSGGGGGGGGSGSNDDSSTADAAKTASTADAAKTASTADAAKTASTADAAKTASTADAAKTASTADAAKTASTADAAKTASTADAAKTASTADAAKTASTDDAAKTASTADAAKTASTADAAKTASTADAAKTASTDDAAKTASTADAAKTASTADAAKTASTADAAKTASTADAAKTASTDDAAKTASSSSSSSSSSTSTSSTSNGRQHDANPYFAGRRCRPVRTYPEDNTGNRYTVRCLPPLDAEVRALCWVGPTALAAGGRGGLVLQNAQHGDAARPPCDAAAEPVRCLASRGRTFVALGSGRLTVWDAAPDARATAAVALPWGGSALTPTWTAAGPVAGGPRGGLLALDVRSPAPAWVRDGAWAAGVSAVHAAGTALWLGSEAGDAAVLDIRTLALLWTLPRHDAAVAWVGPERGADPTGAVAVALATGGYKVWRRGVCAEDARAPGAIRGGVALGEAHVLLGTDAGPWVRRRAGAAGQHRVRGSGVACVARCLAEDRAEVAWAVAGAGLSVAEFQQNSLPCGFDTTLE